MEFFTEKNLDPIEIFEWLTLHKDQGENRCLLAVFYEYGIGTFIHEDSAFKNYKLAAEEGDTLAQAFLSLCYCYDMGIGTAVDRVKAFEWYEKAAIGGSVAAQCNCGNCLLEGRGVQENVRNAYIWYRKSANGLYHKAEHMLGYCHEFGVGTLLDIHQAIIWGRRALKNGNVDAKVSIDNIFTLSGFVEY
ncbi:4029_t:CDS:2 [Ambispora gerdemannii]|uniref:4029_t:CDS:1 n=1 Tax=Ambispora gerdemannii TaxID=144530 RepID=A0A9N9AA97_9GLOM|nr:4029_t:CDS:2 [Ambispora gerdemannii]